MRGGHHICDGVTPARNRNCYRHRTSILYSHCSSHVVIIVSPILIARAQPSSTLARNVRGLRLRRLLINHMWWALLLAPFVVLTAGGTNLIEFLRSGNKTIICLGDSLTHGFIPVGPTSKIVHKPYAARLDALLNNDLLGGTASRIDVRDYGVDGDHTEKMKERLKNIIAVSELQAQNALHPHHIGLVIILTGTNDVCSYQKNETVIAAIAAMHSAVHRLTPKAYSIAITMPDLQPWIHEDQHRINYLTINAAIRNLQAKSRGNIVGLLEMENRWIPRETEDRGKYWSQDNVHLSELGYRYMGEAIYAIMRDTPLQE